MKLREKIFNTSPYRYRVYTQEANYYFTSERDKNMFVDKYKKFVRSHLERFSQYLHFVARYTYQNIVSRCVELITNALDCIKLDLNYTDVLFCQIVYKFFDISIEIKNKQLADLCIDTYKQRVFDCVNFKCRGKFYYEIK